MLLVLIISKRIFTALKSQWTSKGAEHFREKPQNTSVVLQGNSGEFFYNGFQEQN